MELDSKARNDLCIWKFGCNGTDASYTGWYRIHELPADKADYAHAAEQKKWELERGKLEQFYGLQKALFSTAWNLAKEYEFPDEYRLTDQQIQDYSKILMEPNAITRYSKLNAIEDKFQVYPQFWYQMGSTANSIYGSNASGLTKAIKELYKAHALECFEKYQELNRFALLREDTLTAAWALEYIDLLDLNHPQERRRRLRWLSLQKRTQARQWMSSSYAPLHS